MSHIVTSKLEMRDAATLISAAQAKGFEVVDGGRVKEHVLFSGQKATGIAIKLPDWNYPAVINPTTGEVKYDNYGGNWGKQIELDKLTQEYAAQVAEQFAQQANYMSSRVVESNGDIVLTMTELQTV